MTDDISRKVYPLPYIYLMRCPSCGNLLSHVMPYITSRVKKNNTNKNDIFNDYLDLKNPKKSELGHVLDEVGLTNDEHSCCRREILTFVSTDCL